METKEQEWHKRRTGLITSSYLHRLMSKSGKFTETNISYLMEIERQRFLNEPSPNITSNSMQHGLDNEIYAVAWVRENMFPEAIYCQELDEIPFKTTNYGLGASFDIFVGWDLHIDCKCPHSNTELSYFFSPSIPYEDKKQRAFEQHSDQMAGQLLCDNMLGTVGILKYDSQRDDNIFDLRSPLDKTRGIYFEWKRDEFDLEMYKKRIKFAYEYLESGNNIQDINKEWELLTKKEKK